MDKSVIKDQFLFSIVVYNIENRIKNTLDSIINQNIGFDKVEILFINDGSEKNYNLALNYKNKFPNNFKIITSNEKNEGYLLNLGLKHASGRYINFINSGDIFSIDTFKRVNDYFNKVKNLNLINIPICIDEENDEFFLEYNLSKNRVLDLSIEPGFTLCELGSFFIKLDFINICFNQFLKESYGSLFINKLLLDSKIGFVSKAILFQKSANHIIDFGVIESVFDKFNYYFKDIIEYATEKIGYLPNFIQYNLANILSKIVSIEDINEISTDNHKIKLFFELLDEQLNNIGFSAIRGNLSMDTHTRDFLIFLKEKDFHIDILNNDEILFYADKHVLNILNEQKLLVDIVEIRKDYLNFSGSIKSNCEYQHIRVEAIMEHNGKKEVYEGKFFDYKTTDRKVRKYLSIPWVYSYNFDVKIPIKDKYDFKVSFRAIYEENNEKIVMHPTVKLRRYSSLSKFSHYFIKGSRTVLFTNNSFEIHRYSWKKICRYEVSSIKKIFTEGESDIYYSIIFRLLFLFLLPFFKNKRIWLFADRRASADDNAQHLFEYSIKQKDSVKKYFIIDKDAPDYKIMKKISRNIVPFGSLRHKILFTFSEKLISSQVNKYVINPFLRDQKYLYNGIFFHEECFIQHGVILHDLSGWLKKFVYNLSLFVTTAELEWESIAHTNYNYEEERIQLLGLPRYDKLVDNSSKQILFIPTWRRDFDDPDLLVNSKYFYNIINFLNNKKLIETSKKFGYKLVFKPHPELWRYIDLFDIPEEFEISYDNYSKLFAESSVMITDYSSIAFDFAYLQKPLIYYQTDDFDEFHYEKGYFDYESMGFGEVIHNEDDLINKIIYYMKNGSILEDEYKKRSDSFFKYRDKNNCKRIYEWLIKN